MHYGGGGTGYVSEQTEWDSTLQKYGIGPYEGLEVQDKPGPKPFVSSNDVEAAEKEKRLGKASLDDLEELEDDEDEAVLAKFRAQRLNELKAQAAKSRSGTTLPEISKQEWKDQVTEAAYSQKVVVLLFKPGEDWCILLERQLAVVAGRFPKIKFVKIVFTSAVSDFPEKSLPCLLVYNKNDPIQQIVGLPYGGGSKMTPDDVEWTLHCKGVLKSEMEEDPRTSLVEDRTKLNYVGAAHIEDY
jgi:hypothetical protein